MIIAKEIFKNRTLVRLLSDVTLIKLLSEDTDSVYNADLLKEYLETIEFYLVQCDTEGLRVFCKNMEECRKNSLKRLFEEKYILSVTAFEQKDVLHLTSFCKDELGHQRDYNNRESAKDIIKNMDNFLEQETLKWKRNTHTFDMLYQIGVEAFHNFNKTREREVYYG